MMKSLLLICIVSSCAYLGFGESQCVETKLGQICGERLTVFDKPVNRFLGIPFAQPPVGELRFKPPQPVVKYDTVVEATKPGSACMQDYSLFGLHPSIDVWFPPENTTSEDCLFLNIWAPQTEPESKLPVLLWIHGGGYFLGSGFMDNMYDGKALSVKGNVIVVSINYRLGMLGFAYLGNEDIPGNAGLLDQQMALKWVHQHISSFGGDPERIMLFGESAGGSSVSAHLGSSGSLPFFKAAAVQSGTMDSVWSHISPERSVSNLRKLAVHLDCTNTEDFKSMHTCLMGAPATRLTANLSPGLTNPFAGPVLGDELFFGGNSWHENVRSADLTDKSILIGTTTREASMMLAMLHPFSFDFDAVNEWSIEGRADFNEMASDYMNDCRVPKQAGKAITTEYGKGTQAGRTYVDKMITLLSDHMFVCPSLELASLLATEVSTAGVYFYQYNHTNSISIYNPDLGPTHASEIDPLFGKPLESTGWTDDERSLSSEMIAYWTNVAKNGSPIQAKTNWPLFHPTSSPKSMELNVGGPNVVSLADKLAICNMWKSEMKKAKKSTKKEL